MRSYDSLARMRDFTATLLQEEDGTLIVSAFGEIDFHNVYHLDILVLKAVSEAGEGGSVIADLNGVEFMDCSGLGSLKNGRDILAESGGVLAVVCGTHVRRVFEAAGLAGHFELYEDLGYAVKRRCELRMVS